MLSASSACEYDFDLAELKLIWIFRLTSREVHRKRSVSGTFQLSFRAATPNPIANESLGLGDVSSGSVEVDVSTIKVSFTR